MRVRKLAIELGENQLALRQGAQALAVVDKASGPVLYVTEPDGSEDMPEVERTFVVVATGDHFDADASNSTYVGTVRRAGGFTWHVFEVAKLPAELAG